MCRTDDSTSQCCSDYPLFGYRIEPLAEFRFARLELVGEVTYLLILSFDLCQSAGFLEISLVALLLRLDTLLVACLHAVEARLGVEQ